MALFRRNSLGPLTVAMSLAAVAAVPSPFAADDLRVLGEAQRAGHARELLRGALVEGGRDDQFYFWDAKTGSVAEAPLSTLALGDLDPALEGSYPATLKDGRRVEVVPVFELLKERLEDYTPEKAHEKCGVSADVIRTLAHKR